jgi:hypothetical protein
VKLYESLGYTFTPHGEAEWLGVATLAAKSQLQVAPAWSNRSRVA